MGKKYLFRALNDNDIKSYFVDKKDILCNLYHSDRSADYLEYYLNYFSEIFGHVNGQNIKYSPLISLSDNFKHVCIEYAIPQAGNYNKCVNRKPIALIAVDEDKIYDSSEKIDEIRRKEFKDNIVVDLTDNRLKKYADDRVIIPTSPRHNKGEIVIGDCSQMSGFSNVAGEYLMLDHINYNEVECIIYPIMQDLLYGINVDFSNDEIIKFINIFNKYVPTFLINNPSFLYNGVNSGINLTDYLANNYSKIEGNTIEKKYDNLKNYKLCFLNKLLDYIKEQENWDNNLKITKLVDDTVYAKRLDNINRDFFSEEKQLYDLLLIEYVGDVYKYNPKTNRYESSNNKIIPYDYMKNSWSLTPKPIKPVQKKKCIRY